ncbi:MAG: hypothetical protein RBS31_01375 [Candidatus Syntrophosphaera sp.]|jgi:hypothetical protein|nr:hypothetical protein [Candidatus Syntrophosphaera sp.]
MQWTFGSNAIACFVFCLPSAATESLRPFSPSKTFNHQPLQIQRSHRFPPDGAFAKTSSHTKHAYASSSVKSGHPLFSFNLQKQTGAASPDQGGSPKK